VEHGIVVAFVDGKVTIDGVAVEHDAIRDVLAKKPRSEVAIFVAAKEAPWGSIVELLDLMVQSGNRTFVLAVRDDRARRTPPLTLPTRGPEWEPPMAPSPGGTATPTPRPVVMIAIDGEGKIRVDGAGLDGPLRARLPGRWHDAHRNRDALRSELNVNLGVPDFPSNERKVVGVMATDSDAVRS
jgi:hypothetical protein